MSIIDHATHHDFEVIQVKNMSSYKKDKPGRYEFLLDQLTLEADICFGQLKDTN